MAVDPRPARTRAALIEAAEHFLAEGEARPPIPALTKLAKVSHGSFYNHFADREELMTTAAFEARMADRWDEYLQLIASFDQPVLGYLAGVYATLSMRILSPRVALMMVTAGPSVFPLLRVESERVTGPWTQMMVADSDDFEVALFIVLSSFHALLRRVVDGTAPADTPRRAVLQYARLLGVPADELTPIFERA